MRVILSANAAAFLKRERAYLEHFNPRAARRVIENLRSAFRLLGDYPQAGSPLKLPGRRRYVCGVYLIDYNTEKSRLVISHIRHGRQADPELAYDDDPMM